MRRGKSPHEYGHAGGRIRLDVVEVDGRFAQGEIQPGQGGLGGARGSGLGGAQGRVQGGGADFEVNRYTVCVTDVPHLVIGPLTSSKTSRGRTFRSAETDAEVTVVDEAYAREKDLALGDTVTISGTKLEIIAPRQNISRATVTTSADPADTLSGSASTALPRMSAGGCPSRCSWPRHPAGRR